MKDKAAKVALVVVLRCELGVSGIRGRGFTLDQGATSTTMGLFSDNVAQLRRLHSR
jgi:hypothetical protein